MVTTALVIAVSSIESNADKLHLDGAVFFMRSKLNGHANIAQYKKIQPPDNTCKTCIIPWEIPDGVDQLWMFTDASQFGHKKGHYYIRNIHYDDLLICKKGGIGSLPDHYSLAVHKRGTHYPDQRWKVKKSKKGYSFYNEEYTEHRIVAFETFKGKTKLGVWDGDLADRREEYWDLVPRYKAKFETKELWRTDNRQGTQDFAETIKITSGIVMTYSESLTTKVGLEATLKKSVAKLGGDVEAKVSTEISKALSKGTEQSWSYEREITFTAPAGKNYRVLQDQVKFNSDLKRDNIIFYGAYTVQERNGEFKN